jgi:DNA-binding HxlR family transcriptional regulator
VPPPDVKKSRANRPAAATEPDRRSPCPIACSLDVFGDRWTLLVIRDLFCGRTRFKDFLASPEGIPTNILADRLERLREKQLIEQVPASAGARRQAYRLTPQGRALGPVLAAVRDWGLAWDKTTRTLMTAMPRTE